MELEPSRGVGVAASSGVWIQIMAASMCLDLMHNRAASHTDE